MDKKIVVLPYKQIFIGFAGFCAFLLFLFSFPFLSSVYVPIVISYFFAFLLNPIVSYLEHRGFGRISPTFAILSIFFLVLLVGGLLVFPRLIGQVRELIDDMPTIIEHITAWASPYSVEYLGYDIFVDWRQSISNLLPMVGDLPATSIVNSFLQGAIVALGTLASLLIIPLLTFYMLKDFGKLNETLLTVFPRRHISAVREITDRLSKVLGNLIRGQFLVCAVLASYYAVALTALGVRLSLLLGVMGGLLNLVPFLGPVVAMAAALGITLISGGSLTLCAAIVGVFVLGNLLDNAILTPKIVGKQVGISPLTIILALLAGGEILGFLGMLLALPVTAMVKVLGGFALEKYFSSKYYQDQVHN